MSAVDQIEGPTEEAQAAAIKQELEVYTPSAGLERLNREQIRYIASTEIVPKALRGRPEAIMATILKGRALGLDDIHSLTAIHFIEGKATLAAETMATLVRRRGHSLTFSMKPGESCTVKGKRGDTGDEGEITWTMAMAKEAGLASKDVWKRYGDNMLMWRATSQLCRFLFADVLMGASYTREEAEEVAERGAVTQAVANLPGVGEQQIRTEALSGPSEAQMNRIARLEERTGDGYKLVLRGVFGSEMASELDEDSATRYEGMLEMGLPPEDSDDPQNPQDRPQDSGQGAESASASAGGSPPDPSERGAGEAPPGDEAPTPEAPTDSAEGPGGEVASTGPDGQAPDDTEPADATTDDVGDQVASSSVDETLGAEDDVGSAAPPAASAPEQTELPGEPPPDSDEVVEGEVVDEYQIPDERLIELAGETVIPIGTYAGTKLADIHPGWIDYGLQNTARLPAPFVEALELWARERHPDIWKAVRGE